MPATEAAPPTEEPAAYAALTGHLREVATLASAAAVLAWDQETGMPPGAGALRAAQLAQLSSLVHQRQTDPRVAEWLDACEADPAVRQSPERAANVRETRRDYQRAVRLPNALVREFAETTSLAQQAWRHARERDRFAEFQPWLDKVVRLSRARAECFRADPAEDLYDALLDEFEPGARAAEVERVFGALRERLTPLVAAVAERPVPDDAVLRVPLPIRQQVAFNRAVAEQIGFRFDEGRLDTSTHPFCQGVGPGDTRLTTRYQDTGFPDALSSTLHEAGHGLYEQGLPKQNHFGEPLAEAASLGIHESQSRLWENMVGRSRAFWEWALPQTHAAFGDALRGISVDEMFRAVNTVRPNLIRVDSDETTYNLHIMLRFDLERALLADDLRPADLPGAWRERMRQDLGLDVPDDRRGALQDIHWSMGAIGYFPTYTLGNLYAAQLWEAVRRDLPALDSELRGGTFAPLLYWLRAHVHEHGRRFTPGELCERATGQPLSPEPLLRYLAAKVEAVYGV